MRKTLSAIIIIVLILVIASVIKSSKDIVAGESIKIGAVLPITGIASIVGENERNGITLAVEEINQAGGINGRPIEIIIEDDATDPKQTVSAIQKLVNVDGVSALIGGVWDFLANAAIPVIEEEKIVMITPSALPDILERKSDYLFITHSPVALHKSALASFLSKETGTKVAIMSVNNLWGKAHLATFKAAADETNKTVVKEVILPSFDNNDIQRELALLKPLNPDVIIAALNFSDSAVFLRKKNDLMVSGKVLGQANMLDGFRKGTIPAADISAATIFVFSDAQNTFNKKYEARFGKPTGTYSDTAYDAVYSIAKAIKNSDGKTDTQSIMDGLRKITDLEGASGIIDFSTNNYPANKVSMLKIFQDGQFVEVK